MRRLLLLSLLSGLLVGPAWADITTGLKGFWKFNEASGTSTADETGANPGTLTDGATLGAVGKIGTAIQFNGSVSRVNFGAGAALDITGTQLTIAAWVYISGNAGSDGLTCLYCRDNGSNNYQVRFLLNDARTQMTLQLNGGGVGSSTAFTAWTLNTWHHVAMVYNGTAVTFYADNVAVGGPSSSVSIASQATFQAQAGRGYSNFFGMNGRLDSLHIYSRALTSGDINELYTDTEAAQARRRSPVLY